MHGFLETSGCMNRLEFAQELIRNPASFYYGVMWNKLYRRDIIRRHRIYCY